MTKAVSRSLVMEFYAAMSSLECERIAPFLDDDVEWTISGPVDLLCFCGIHRGKAAVMDLFGRQVPSVYQSKRFVPEMILADGDQAAILSRLSATKHGSDRVVSYRVAQFVRFRDGKVIENCSVIDSFDAVEQVLGHPIEVNDGRNLGPPGGEGGVVAL